MVKTKLKLKESLKNLKSTESAGKAESVKKNKKVVVPVEEEELEEDNLASDTKKIISQISEENGSETLSHKEQRKLKKALKRLFGLIKRIFRNCLKIRTKIRILWYNCNGML